MTNVIKFPSAYQPKGVQAYHPELRERQPQCEMEAVYSVGKYRITTPIALKGVGIKFHHAYTEDLVVRADPKKIGWNIYYVTLNAFNKLKEKYSVSMELRFD